MKKMNFYTSNGWAGKNYDGQSTKEIAKIVRGYARKRFPGFKFSIRYEWGMNADTIYIELVGGPCMPFVPGSRCAERGYLSTGNSAEPFKQDLTPKVFNALDGVVRYANSYRYNDSDAMTDYFDTNFYVCIEIGKDYKVTDPKPGKAAETKKDEEAVKVPCAVAGLEVVDYSEKAVAVFGDTKAVRGQLKELGGRFNPSLNYNGSKRAGWVFSKKKADELRALLAPSKVDAATEPEPLPSVPETVVVPESAKGEEAYASELSDALSVEAVRPAKMRMKSLQDIVDQTMRINGYAGNNWYWSTGREKMVKEIYGRYAGNMASLGGLAEPNRKFRRDEYAAAPLRAGEGDSKVFRRPGVVAYEKTCQQGGRYEAKYKSGGWWVCDRLDHGMSLCISREEAESEAARWNGMTDGNGRLKSVI